MPSLAPRASTKTKPYSKPSAPAIPQIPLPKPSARPSIILDPNSRPKAQKNPRARQAHVLFRDSILRQHPEQMEVVGRGVLYARIHDMWNEMREWQKEPWYALEQMEKEELSRLRKGGGAPPTTSVPRATEQAPATVLVRNAPGDVWDTHRDYMPRKSIVHPTASSNGQSYYAPQYPSEIPHLSEEEEDLFQKYIQLPTDSPFV